MRLAGVLLLFLAVTAVAAPVPKVLKKPRPDAEAFAGKWDVVCEENGFASSRGIWTFDAELKMSVTSPNGVAGSSYLVTLDPDKTPKEIDLGELKGIYAIDGDDIRIAFTSTGGKRPTNFDPKPGVYDNRLRRMLEKGK